MNVINDNDLVLLRFNICNELVEQVRGIMWSWTGFWMVLHGETIFVFHAHSGNRLVIEMQVRDLHFWMLF